MGAAKRFVLRRQGGSVRTVSTVGPLRSCVLVSGVVGVPISWFFGWIRDSTDPREFNVPDVLTRAPDHSVDRFLGTFCAGSSGLQWHRCASKRCRVRDGS